MFRDGAVPVEISWVNMVLFSIGKGGYRGIRLVEVLWKVCAVVVNFRIKSSAVLHDAIHRFRTGIGIRTVTLQSGPVAGGSRTQASITGLLRRTEGL